MSNIVTLTCPGEECQVPEVNDCTEQLADVLGDVVVHLREDEEGKLRGEETPVPVVLRDPPRGGPRVHLDHTCQRCLALFGNCC